MVFHSWQIAHRMRAERFLARRHPAVAAVDEELGEQAATPW